MADEIWRRQSDYIEYEPEWTTLEGRGKSFRLSFPPNWTRQDDEDGTVSLAPERGSAAVIISTRRHRNPLVKADAHEHLLGFIESLKASSLTLKHRSSALSSAECVDDEGYRWVIIAVAKKNAITIISLNGVIENHDDHKAWAEGEEILNSVS